MGVNVFDQATQFRVSHSIHQFLPAENSGHHRDGDAEAVCEPDPKLCSVSEPEEYQPQRIDTRNARDEIPKGVFCFIAAAPVL
jgi:hypothetical protein